MNDLGNVLIDFWKKGLAAIEAIILSEKITFEKLSTNQSQVFNFPDKFTIAIKDVFLEDFCFKS